MKFLWIWSIGQLIQVFNGQRTGWLIYSGVQKSETMLKIWYIIPGNIVLGFRKKCKVFIYDIKYIVIQFNIISRSLIKFATLTMWPLLYKRSDFLASIWSIQDFVLRKENESMVVIDFRILLYTCTNYHK